MVSMFKIKFYLLSALILAALCAGNSAFAKIYPEVSGNQLTLVESPQASVDLKVELIKKAKHHVHIITFFWDDSTIPKTIAMALKEAHGRGVEVRILTTMVASLGTDLFGKGKREFKDIEEGAVFSYLALAPGSNISLTNNLHEKIFLVDGQKAIIGGRNISDSSLSGKDLEVMMEGPVVNQVQDHFKIMNDFLIDRKIKSACRLKNKTKCKNKLDKLRFSSENQLFFPAQPIYESGDIARIITHEALLKQAQLDMGNKDRLNMEDDILNTVTSINFETMRAYNYFMIPTQKYLDYIEKNLEMNRSVSLITNSYKAASFSLNHGYLYSLPEALELVNKGLKLSQWLWQDKNQGKLAYVHEKVIIYDEDHVIIGSHNFGTGSTAVSNEIAIEIKSYKLAQRLIEVFDSEVLNPEITSFTTSDYLRQEINEHKKLIKILRSKPVGAILREIY